ncbi:MAG: hypothetical protein SVS85_04160, partial [Candidatus Nanohaloarchaea archaeon]|nr:hypothetical protein [Candidatus Nanohaloarchaea archaeon]
SWGVVTSTRISPPNGSRIQPGEKLKFSVRDEEGHFQSATFTNGTGTNYTLPSPFDINTSNWPEGEVSVNVYANDTAGNMNTTHWRFTVDGTPPDLSIFSPSNKTVGDDSPWLNVTASEPIRKWKYAVDGGDNTTFTPNTTFGPLSEGKHTVSVYAIGRSARSPWTPLRHR